MADALYIGSLVVENIKARPKGQPSIELVIASTASGEIAADAVDLDTSVQGEHQSLKVSLKSLDDDNREYEIPDFELEQNDGPPTELFEKPVNVQQEDEKKHGSAWLIVVCVVLVLVAIGLAAWLFLFRGGSGTETAVQSKPAPVQPVEPPQAPAAPVQQAAPQTAPTPPPAPPPVQPPAPPAAQPSAPPPVAQTPPPVIQAPAKAPAKSAAVSRKRTAAPVTSYKVPLVIPKGGAAYKIRWGDTLWDIADAFYRNPWLYPRIARFNNIPNPDLIISGRTIRIPPRK